MTILKTLKWLGRTQAANIGDGKADRESACLEGVAGTRRHTATDLCGEGEALLARGENEAALTAFQSAIDHGDESAAGHLGQARAYLALERRQDAADSLEIALAIEPEAIPALMLLARIRREAGAMDEALELLRRARSIAPANESILSDLALTLNRCGNTDEAIDVYSEAIRVAPRDPRPRVNLGLIHLLQLGDASGAETHFRLALAVAPEQIEASANLGLALHDQGRYDEELETYRRALAMCPESAELRWNQALANLSAGHFREGWGNYDLRFARRGGRNLTRFNYREWDGSPMPQSRLLVLAEQGLGDEIMFASCLPELAALAKGVVLEAAPRLARLFSRSFPQFEVHGRERHAPLEWLRQFPDIDAKAPIGSLPRRLRCDLADFPRHAGYLRADSARTNGYRSRLAEHGAASTVGVSWRGGTSATRSSVRSVPLADLGPLLAMEPIRFVCLQHRLNPEERELARAMGMTVLDEPLADIDELAALVSALDLVITVDNLNLHMAGALGRPAWGLLGAAPDWRWLRQGISSPWYPSIRLFRTADFGSWDDMLREVTERLQLSLRSGDMRGY